MKLDRYELKTSHNLTTFEFFSEGKNGRIMKVIQFQPMNLENLCNLAIGDKNTETGELDDKIVTDNGDSEKVLATVVAAIYAFADRYPERQNEWEEYQYGKDYQAFAVQRKKSKFDL